MKQIPEVVVEEQLAAFILKKNNFIHSSVRDMELLLAKSSLQTYRKKERIYSVLDPVRYVYVIEKGTVELFNYTSGKLQKKTFSVLNKGNIFGYGELAEPQHVLYAVAETACGIRKITQQDFLDTISANANLARDFFLSMAHQISQHQKAMLLDNARGKVLNYLGWMCEEFGVRDGKTMTIPRRLTNEQIGNLLFLTRETVVRTFQNLESEGILTMDARAIIIHDMETVEEERVMTRKNILQL